LGAFELIVTVYWNPSEQVWSASSATVNVAPEVGAVNAVV
jgi:hypothetical protein